MPPRRTSAGISVRDIGTGTADRVPQVRGRGRATLDRHPQPHIPPRRVLRPATFCDQPLPLPHRRIRPDTVCRVTGTQNSGTQHESAPDNDDSSLMLPDRVYRASESYSATAAGLATLEPSDGSASRSRPRRRRGEMLAGPVRPSRRAARTAQMTSTSTSRSWCSARRAVR